MSPRPKRLRKISNPPLVRGFKPYGLESKNIPDEPVFLLYEEYESIRLCDYEMLNHLEASALMGISRPTLTRIYAKARQKIAEAFVKGYQIVFEGGKVYFDSDWYKCSNCGCFFNHPYKDNKVGACPLCGSNTISNYNNDMDNILNENNTNYEVCICLQCGYEGENQVGLPCTKAICPKCNVHLVQKIDT